MRQETDRELSKNCSMQDFTYVEDYVHEFARLYNKLDKYDGLQMTKGARALQLLENANLSDKDTQLVLTGVNLDEPDTLYERMEKSILKFFGKQTVSSTIESSMRSIKLK